MKNHLSFHSLSLPFTPSHSPHSILLFSFFIFQFSFCRADVIADFRFEGTLGDKINVSIDFAVNDDGVAVGEIIYLGRKNPKPILLVGVWSGDEYFLDEYSADGTVTGCLRLAIDDTTYNEPILTSGSWTNPKSGQVYEMKNMEYLGTSSNSHWNYAKEEAIDGEYAFHQWDRTSNTLKEGHATFRLAGDHKVRFEVINKLQGSYLKSAADRPAELIAYTYNDFNYENANECGYSISVHFFTDFVVIKNLTEDPETAMCNGRWDNVTGVYFKVKGKK